MALPDDLADWPTTALSGCTNLEVISVYGPESDTGHISLNPSYNLHSLTHLVHVTLPSTVTFIGEPLPDNHRTSTFPENIQTFSHQKNLTTIGAGTFIYCQKLRNFDFSACRRLQSVYASSVRATALPSLDLSLCPSLTQIGDAAFFFCNKLIGAIFPPSLTKIETAAFETVDELTGTDGRGRPPPIKTIIWKGRTARPALNDSTGIHSSAFVLGQPLDTLVTNGSITEICIP